jgi:hypothetical protein
MIYITGIKRTVACGISHDNIMADVAAIDIRKVQNKLLEWEQPDRPLAPLSTSQRDAVLDLSQEVNTRTIPHDVSGIN